jgi:hypothetical protein
MRAIFGEYLRAVQTDLFFVPFNNFLLALTGFLITFFTIFLLIGRFRVGAYCPLFWPT